MKRSCKLYHEINGTRYCAGLCEEREMYENYNWQMVKDCLSKYPYLLVKRYAHPKKYAKWQYRGEKKVVYEEVQI